MNFKEVDTGVKMAKANFNIAKSQFSKVVDKNWTGLRILGIDDNPDDREMLRCSFERAGLELKPATDISCAYKLIHILQPHFIVLDVCGVTEFELIIQDFSEKVLICSGLNGGMDNRIKETVRACFGKDEAEVTRMIQFVKDNAQEFGLCAS